MTIPISAARCEHSSRKSYSFSALEYNGFNDDQIACPAGGSTDDASLGALRFGRFRLLPKERVLYEGDRQVHLGGRAFEVLIALLERPGQLICKNELMKRVWPSVFVQPSNLTVHIAALRRALKDGQDGNRFIVNTVGRGYVFVGSVVREPMRRSVLEAANTKSFGNLPPSLTPLLGRSAWLAKLIEALSRQRIVTLVGPGGVGKTSLALEAARRAESEMNKDILFVDLTTVETSKIAATISSALDVYQFRESSPVISLANSSMKQLLLILDACEAVIGDAADLVCQLIGNLNTLQVLVTSREPLRVEGERVLRLPPLDFPQFSTKTTLHELLAYPAAQLFIERATANFEDFWVDDNEAEDLAEICRRLDGIPLAIQLAARRVNSLGLSGIAKRLSNPFRLLTGGSRGAQPRQRSMRATLDWSYDLLTKREQAVLCRLSRLEGWFSLDEAAESVFAFGCEIDDVVDTVFELVAKSLVLREAAQGEPLFCLSELTRAYARMKLNDLTPQLRESI